MPTRDEMYDIVQNEGWSTDSRMETALKARWMDESLGALYKWLKNNDLLDNTTIMVMNDHGQGAKESLYEQGIRMMNYIRFPALAFGHNFVPYNNETHQFYNLVQDALEKLRVKILKMHQIIIYVIMHLIQLYIQLNHH